MIRGVIAPDLQRRRTTGTTVRTTIAPQDFQDLVQLADEECTSISALLRRLVVRELRRQRALHPGVA
jgi:hypothetical protein